MNKARRKRIAIVLDKLRVANEELTAIRDEEQDAYDNLPENIQTGLRGDDMQENDLRAGQRGGGAGEHHRRPPGHGELRRSIMSAFKYDLGEVLKDRITGFEGVAVARTQYMTGCNRYSLQSQELKDGKPREWEAFDEDMLVPSGEKKEVPVRQTGGPPKRELSRYRSDDARR